MVLGDEVHEKVDLQRNTNVTQQAEQRDTNVTQ
jgi:hypothetical protein